MRKIKFFALLMGLLSSSLYGQTYNLPFEKQFTYLFPVGSNLINSNVCATYLPNADSSVNFGGYVLATPTKAYLATRNSDGSIGMIRDSARVPKNTTGDLGFVPNFVINRDSSVNKLFGYSWDYDGFGRDFPLTLPVGSQFIAFAYDRNRQGIWTMGSTGNITLIDFNSTVIATINYTSNATTTGLAWDSSGSNSTSYLYVWGIEPGNTANRLTIVNAQTGTVVNTYSVPLSGNIGLASGAEVINGIVGNTNTLLLTYKGYGIVGYKISDIVSGSSMPGKISNISTPNDHYIILDRDQITLSWKNPPGITKTSVILSGNQTVYTGAPITKINIHQVMTPGFHFTIKINCTNDIGTTYGDEYGYIASFNSVYFDEHFTDGFANVTVTNDNQNGGWRLTNATAFPNFGFDEAFAMVGTDSCVAPVSSTLTFNKPFSGDFNCGLLVKMLYNLHANDTLYFDTASTKSGAWGHGMIITYNNHIGLLEYMPTPADDTSATRFRITAKLNSSNAYLAVNNVTRWGCTLPVELISFDVKSTSSGMKLDWSTATELNNLGFQVERKINEGGFLPIAFIKGEGNSTTPKKYSYLDNSEPKGKITYRLKQLDYDGSYSYSKEIELDAFGAITYNLLQNYPNPFNPSTEIVFNIGNNERVRLEVYNLLGEKVKTLIDNELSIGEHKAIWNGTTQSGNIAPSGVYIIKLTSDSFSKSIKASLLK